MNMFDRTEFELKMEKEALEIDPTLDGVQLDRIGNFLADQHITSLDTLTTPALKRAIRKVKARNNFMWK